MLVTLISENREYKCFADDNETIVSAIDTFESVMQEHVRYVVLGMTKYSMFDYMSKIGLWQEGHAMIKATERIMSGVSIRKKKTFIGAASFEEVE